MKEASVNLMIMGISEPTSTVASQWSSSQISTGVKTSQWTDQDLDAFVRQLSNPQHHVSKIGSTGSSTSPSSSPRKSSLELQTDRPRRAPLARSETDSSVHFADRLTPSPTEHTATGFGGRHSSESGTSSLGSGLLSGLSGLRLIKNKKLARSSHANAKKCMTQKSLCHEYYAPTKDETTIEADDTSNGGTTRTRMVSTGSVTFSGGASSPEGSDGEKNDERKLSGSRDGTDANSSSATSNAKEGKKRRFRRMLSRPLRRSQSAGCAKDVPAHVAFLGQRKDSDEKDSDSTLRKERSSEGDIMNLPVFDDDDNDDNNDTPSSSSIKTSRSSSSIGKKGADSDDVALVGDDYGAPGHSSKTKSKNYNIAKKISKHMQFLRRRHTDSLIGTSDKDEVRRLSDLEPDLVQSWSKSFESLLFDRNGLELFRGFLISEHSDENIEFWIACENYKVVKSHKQLAPMAHKIFNDYVAVQSRREVNLDSKTRNSTYENVTSNPNRQTFDDAQKRVQALMEKDSYRRFLESELYVDLVSGNLSHKT